MLSLLTEQHCGQSHAPAFLETPLHLFTELAQLIRDDKVDILVELTGHTASNRLGAVARRPAPIQVGQLHCPWYYLRDPSTFS